MAAFIWGGSVNGQIVVNTSSEAVLRSAISSAQSSGKTIQLTFTGTLTLANTLEIAANTVIDAGTYAAVISGGSTCRVFHVIGGKTLTLKNLSITKGLSAIGPGVYNEGGTLIVSNCTFSSNMATNATGANGSNVDTGNGGSGGIGGAAAGGAIYSSGALYIYDSTFTTNTVYAGDGGSGGQGGSDSVVGGKGGKGGNGGSASGGAIYIFGSAEIYRTSFEGNICSGGLGGTPGAGGAGGITGDGGDSGIGGVSLGAGIYNEGSLKLVGCLFSGNLGYGGNSSGVVAYPQGGTRKAGSGAASRGGGLFSNGSFYSENCTFFENTCAGGAGGSVTTGGYTTSGNGGDACGGAVANMAGTAELINCTLATNNAVGGTNGTSGVVGYTGSKGGSQGGNLYRGGGVFKISNSILSRGTNGANAFGGVTDGGYNLSSDSSAKFTATGSLNSTAANLDSGLAANDGTTYTLALLPDSPAVNAIPTNSTYPAIDQRGFTRPQGEKADIGAFELDESNFGPSISVDPVSTNVVEGARVTFSVTATGVSPLNYQWTLNDAPILNATNATYTIASASTFDAGNYALTLSNPYGGPITSGAATLSVLVPASIVTQPVGQTVIGGNSLTLSVQAAGDGALTYQWYHNKKVILGQNDSVLTIASVQPGDAGNYWVVVSNDAGSVKSATVAIRIIMPAAITAMSADQSVVLGKSVSLSVTASGAGPLYYQWFLDGKLLAKATGPKITVSKASLANMGGYTVVVSNSVSSLTSAPVYLGVVPPAPVITTTAKQVVSSNLVFQGTIVTNAQITKVVCNLGGVRYSAAISGSKWSVALPLSAGTNIVTTFAIADYGTSDLVVSRYFLTVLSPLSVALSGSGTVTPNLNSQSLIIGKSYSMTAKPSVGNLFKEWDADGVSIATTPKLTFVMSSDLELTAVFEPDPFLPIKGTYAGLFDSQEVLALTNSGALNLVLKDQGVYSGTLQQGSTTYRFTGQFTPDGQTTISRGSLTPLTVSLDFENSTNNLLYGTVTDGDWTSTYVAARSIYSASKPVPGAGRYTLSLSTSEDNIGYGVAALNVTAAGAVTLSGSLVDGASMTGSGTVCAGGFLPVYVPVNSGAGLVAGWITITNASNASGLRWKTPGNGVFYTGGLVTDFSYDLSQYAAVGTRALSLTNATITLAGGNLSESLTLLVAQTANNVFTASNSANGLKLTATASNGLVTGSFIHPVTGNVATIKAVVLQNGQVIAGYFHGADTSGSVYLQATQ